MNNYLLFLGTKFAEIRQILNLTQEDLANRMGVSRPTVVKIEQDPSRLTKTLAYAFFIAVTAEISQGINRIKELDPKAFKSPDKLKNFVEEIKKSSWLPVGALVAVATLSLGIPGIAAIITASASVGAKYGLKSLKKKSPATSIEQINWDEEKVRMLIQEVQKKLLEDQKKVLSCFQLEALEIEEFVKKIDESEVEMEV